MANVKVRDLLRSRSLLSVRPGDDLALAQQMMLWGNVRHLPVLDNGALVGVLTEHDILRHLAERGGARDAVSSAMTREVTTIAAESDLAQASALLLSRQIGCLPVMSGKEVLGILTRTDILGAQVTLGPAESAAADGPPVSLIMRRSVATVSPDQPLLDAVALMVDRDVRHVPVVDPEGRVVGIISDRDVRTALGDPLEALRRELDEVELLTVAGVMTAPVITARREQPLSQVAQRFIDDRVGAIPVVDEGGALCGIVSYVDVIRALRERGGRR